MTDHELEQKIRTAVGHAAPDQLNSILSSCDEMKTAKSPFSMEREQKEGDIIHMSEKSRSGRKGFAAVAAAAAVLLLFAGAFGLMKNNMVRPVDSVVILDVNPSISLSVDEKEKVLAAEALNEDAKDILGNMDLKDTSLEVAVNAIIGSMLQKGYLGDMQNSILVSVENQDAVRGEQIQKKVSQAIADAMRTDTMDAAVLSQVVDADDSKLADLAEKYQISMGKAALIQEVTAQVPTLTFESLAPMTINEIALIASSRNVSGRGVSQSGAASAKAYIGQEEALSRACAHAQIEIAQAQRVRVEFDSEDGIMVYEVDFEDSANEYEYDIDAITGEVLKFERDPRKGMAAASKAAVGSGMDADYEHHHSETHEHHGTNSSAAAENTSYIDEAAAWEAALEHAGVTENSLTKKEIKLDREDGRMIYEIEFEVGRKEYEYEIDAVSGEILKAEIDLDD